MYLMVKNNMRGGIATISHRYARPIILWWRGTTPLNSQVLFYMQMQIICMSAPLPVEQEITDFNLMDIPFDSDMGYIIECDLTYFERLRHLHNDYPMAHNHLAVSPDMLSDVCNEIEAPKRKPTKKLIEITSATIEICNFTLNTGSLSRKSTELFHLRKVLG